MVDACSALRKTLAVCEQQVAGRCATSAAACDTKRAQYHDCLERSKQLPPTTKDANGRSYALGSDGTVLIDDSRAKSNLLPPLDLPRLAGLPECGKSHCVAVSALGEAISWATSARDGGRYGQLGWGSAHVEAYTPHRIQLGANKTVKAAAGDDHSAFVDAAGGLWLCGVDRWEQLGRGAVLWKGGAVWQREPKPVPALQNVRVIDVACGADHTIALDEERRVWAWGRGEHGQLFGASNRPLTSPPTVSAALSKGFIAKLEALANRSCSVDAAGGRRCVGRQ